MLIFEDYLLLCHDSWSVLYLSLSISEILWEGTPFVTEKNQDNRGFWRESVGKAKKTTQ